MRFIPLAGLRVRAFLLFIEHLGPARVFILRLVLLVDVAGRKTESHCFGRLALICSSHVGQLVGGVLGRFLGLEFGGTIHVVLERVGTSDTSEEELAELAEGRADDATEEARAAVKHDGGYEEEEECKKGGQDVEHFKYEGFCY